jgi:site-specific DNA-methyltransferase (adenine-specific)
LIFLESNLQPTNQKFDVIFTNPPWGKKITREQKNTYSKVLKAGKSNDTSSLFFFASLNNLENNGYLGFLLQDAFFNIASYESARDKALSKQILAVIDFNKPFTGLITKAKGILIKNQDSNDNSIVKCENKNKNFNRLQYSFLSNPKLILNTNISQGEADVVAYLYSLNHITLFNKARWGLGIVTGNNKKFIQHIQTQGLVPVYKGVDIDKNHIANASNYISDDLSIYQQTATKELYLAPEKLIYRFISSDLVFYYDTKQRYILNSANFLIPNSNFLISQSQLKDILNSRVVNWMFKSIFNTHKVLRSDLEILPIHFGYFDKYEYFDDDVFISYLGLKECSDGTFRIKK